QKVAEAMLTKEDFMNNLDDREAIERLRKVGCTALEIERLRRLRRDYAENGGDQALRDRRRPAFVRWLVTILQEGTPVSAPWWW
ncbi:MAG: hypothetical protein ACREP9_13740, partial [Candidatus Dormibacteraceae bacterium]